MLIPLCLTLMLLLLLLLLLLQLRIFLPLAVLLHKLGRDVGIQLLARVSAKLYSIVYTNTIPSVNVTL
jgi:hypothetical protein